MRGSFFENSNVGEQVKAVRLAVIQLCLAGYIVLETRTKSQNEQPSIMIDRPFEECSYEVTHVAEKAFGSCEKWKCRIFWIIQPAHSRADTIL